MSVQRILDLASAFLDPARRIKLRPRVAGCPVRPFGLKHDESQLGVLFGHPGPFPTPARGFAAHAHVLRALFWGLAGFWGSVVVFPILILVGSGILSW